MSSGVALLPFFRAILSPICPHQAQSPSSLGFPSVARTSTSWVSLHWGTRCRGSELQASTPKTTAS